MSILTRVEISNVRGQTLALPLQDSSGGYLVKTIDGLDPVKATLVSSTQALVDGAQPQSSSLPTRNITAQIELKPNWATNDVRSLRSAMYKVMMPKDVVTAKFFFDDVIFAQTVATVESLENSMFTQDPEMDLSLICYDPSFYATAAQTFSGNTVANTTTSTITYDGTVDAGAIFTLNVNAAMTGVTLYNTRPDNTTQVFDLEVALQAGDVVTISSVPLSKGVTLTRSGVKSSLLYAVGSSRTWISLQNGNNLFRAYSSVANVPFTLSYTPKYGAL